mgnify:CR=1 FL=1
MLEDETERKKCLEVVEEARDRVEKMVSFCFFPTHKSVRSCPWIWHKKQVFFCLLSFPQTKHKHD